MIASIRRFLLGALPLVVLILVSPGFSYSWLSELYSLYGTGGTYSLLFIVGSLLSAFYLVLLNYEFFIGAPTTSAVKFMSESPKFHSFKAAAAEFGLDVGCRSDGKHTWVFFDGLLFELELSKETFRTKVAKGITGADIEIGDSYFDDAAMVHGASLEILSRLDAAQRLRVHSLFSLRGSIAHGVLSVPALSGKNPYIFDFDLESHWEWREVLEFARGFSETREGTKEERLLGILHGDPNPAVRAKVLAEMMRHPDELELDLDELLCELILGARRQVEQTKRRERLKRMEPLRRKRQKERARRLETLQSRIQSEKQRLRAEFLKDEKQRLRAELLIELEPSRWRQPEHPDRSSLDRLIAEATEIEAWLEADNTEGPIMEATEVTEAIATEVTEAIASEFLLFAEPSLAVLSAAYWLREHGEAAESVAALSEVLADSPSQEVSAVAGQALAAIRSRLGQFAGGLALSETQDAGALSLAEQGGQLALSEEGQLSVSEEEAERKRRAAVERQKG